MGSNDPAEDPAPSRTDSKIGFSRRRFFSLASAGALAAAGVTRAQLPTVEAQENSEPRKPNRRNVMVPMTDNVELATDVYLPERPGPHPTIVNRTPYSKGDTIERSGYLLALLDSGYAVVKQDCRGRHKSEGDWEPMFNEQEDGYDTVEWAAGQDWSTGKVGMFGVSYGGFTTWQAAIADPPSLEAIVPVETAANFYTDWQYDGGAFELGRIMFWASVASNITGPGQMEPRIPYSEEKIQELRAELEDIDELYRYLPVNENPAFDDHVAPFYFEWLLYDQYGEYWERIDVLQHIENVSAKVLTIGGFHDPFLEAHTDAWTAISERGKEPVRATQHMILGPWTHGALSSAPVGEREVAGFAGDVGSPADVRAWFDRWLKEDDSAESFPPIQYYQTGADPKSDEWRSAKTWPPKGTTTRQMYLNSDGNANSRDGDGMLSTDNPDGGADTDEYEYDPLNPTPTTGVRSEGVFDQRAVEARDDVLVFTSEELNEPVDVVGVPEMTLFVESTAPDTDFGVKLVDAHPDGYAANITQTFLRARYRETSNGESYREAEFMEPGNVYELTLDLEDVAHTFEEGHRIRLDITSSNFPRFDRNPNRAMDVASATEDDMQTATNTIYHDCEHASHVVLPVKESEPDERGETDDRITCRETDDGPTAAPPDSGRLHHLRPWDRKC